MRKVTIFSAAAVMVYATQLQAAPADDLHLTAFVNPICEVTNSGLPTIDFGDVSIGLQTQVVNLFLQCNDAEGAVVKLISVEGGLESDDKEDHAIKYDATFAPLTLTPFTLSTTGGPGVNDQWADHNYSGSSALAAGMPTTLTIATQETMPWAGGYSDTLAINITAN
ncbi:hypothetical protein [Alteromonas ponticola]|uniref:Spore coat protein U domain-containing protein n=1 Tax=Alteromonas ponticola TaxID=2720613 RepID=A0ABX1R1Y0_9ALTE|nr:hypothetical protein [Alteromonas ponticola]NMH60470.1 hypothetical protein [Alteromonas ponticola]